jgi:FixJ family two-component response regulator
MADSLPYHVFFVDDELEVRNVVQKTLERRGIKVTCFASASTCLKHLQAEKCDLIITDVKMPGMDGMELLEEVKRTMPWFPILVVTGYGDIPMAVKALKAGAVSFIEKPLDRDSFLSTVDSVLIGTTDPDYPSPLPLTPAESEVLQFILTGMSNRKIADILHRSRRTIETHRGHIMRKFGVNKFVDLIRRATAMGLFDKESDK